MARITPVGDPADLVGKLGGDILERRNGDIYVRPGTDPPKERDTLRQRARALLSILSKEYDPLTTQQKIDWKAYADALGGTFNAPQAWIRNNLRLLYPDHVDLVRIYTPPDPPNPPAAPVGFASSYNDTEDRWEFTWTSPDSNVLYVEIWQVPITHYRDHPWAMKFFCSCHRSDELGGNLTAEGYPYGTVQRFWARTIDLNGEISGEVGPVEVEKEEAPPVEEFLYVTDTYNHRIKKHQADDWTFSAKIGSQGTGNDQFQYPFGICVTGDYLFICDKYNNRIVKRLKSDLSYVAQVAAGFRRPTGICTDGTYLYMTDDWNDRVEKRNVSDMALVLQFGSTGSGDNQFNSPEGIDTDGTYIYLCDALNHRIKKHLCSDLTYVSKIGTRGGGNDQFNAPQGMCVLAGILYIGDTANDRIQKRYASDLSFIAKFGTAGSGDDQFQDLKGVFVKGSYLWICDTTNNRLKRHFVSDLSYDSKYGSSGSGDDQFSLPWGITGD